MILHENILKRMSKADRSALGKGNETVSELGEKWAAGQEKELQKLISSWLNLRGDVYVEMSPYGRKTDLPKGTPDFRICYRGRYLAIECKAKGGVTSKEQDQAIAKIKAAGGIAIVAFGLDAVRDALTQIDKEIETK